MWEHPGLLLGNDAEHAVLNDGGALVLVRTSDGAEVWRRASVVPEGKHPRAGVGYGVVVLTEARTPALACFDAVTGAPKWDAPLALPKRGYLPQATPLITERAVLRTDGSDRVVAYDVDGGQVVGNLKDRTDRGLDDGAAVSRERPSLVAIAHRGDSAAAMYLVTLAEGAPKRAKAKAGATKALKSKASEPVDLVARVRAYFELLGKRRDLRVLENTIEPGVADDAIEARVPADLRAFAHRIGGLTFTWILAGEDPEGSSPGYNGGRFAFSGAHLGAFHEADWAAERDGTPFTHFIGIDNLVAEANGWLVLPKSGGAAIMGFESSNDDAFTPFASFEDYVTQGAKRAFCWYWPNEGGEGHDFVETLLDNSVAADTPKEELVALIEERGAEPTMARALVDWLGSDVRVLLDRD